MALYDKAIVKLVPTFKTPMSSPVRINNHTAVSNADSLYPYFASPSAGGVGSHFYIRRDGVVEQYVDTSIKAAADYQGNPDTISIETWDGFNTYWVDGDPVPDFTVAQKLALLDLWDWILRNHPSIPKKLATDSKEGLSSHGISWHLLGVPATATQLNEGVSQTGGMLYSKWIGKTCPGTHKIASIKSLFEILNGEPITKDRLGQTMFNPFVGRVTSGYRTANRPNHTGIDIAPPVAGTVGGTFYAAFAGRVVKTVSTRVPGQTDRVNELAPFLTGNGVIVRNPDGEYQVYNHGMPTVNEGDWVEKGTGLAKADRSGNQTGPHLHFETWTSNKVPFNPMILFDKYKVTPGVASVSVAGTVDKADQIRLEASGHYSGAIDGIAGPVWLGAVRAFQTENCLVVDGNFGPVSRNKYDTKYKTHHTTVQTTLSKLIRVSTGKPYYNGYIDGIVDNFERQAVLDFQKDNGLLQNAMWCPRTQSVYDNLSIILPPTPAPEPTPVPVPEPEPTPVPEEGTPILAQAEKTLDYIQGSLKTLGSNDLFIYDMVPALYVAAIRYQIDPYVLIGQSAHETGFGKFGRAVTPEHHNTCGLKIMYPVGTDDNPEDHARFDSWERGATAHAQHLYAYMNKALPAGEVLIDPRWGWVYGKHTLKFVEELGGKWAPAITYGTTVTGVVDRIRSAASVPTTPPVEPTEPPVEPTPTPEPTEPPVPSTGLTEERVKEIVDASLDAHLQDVVSFLEHLRSWNRP